MFRNYRIEIGAFAFYKRMEWQAAEIYRKRMKQIYRFRPVFRMDQIEKKPDSMIYV